MAQVWRTWCLLLDMMAIGPEFYVYITGVVTRRVASTKARYLDSRLT